MAVSPKYTAFPLNLHYLPQIPTKVHDSDFHDECQARQQLSEPPKLALQQAVMAAGGHKQGNEMIVGNESRLLFPEPGTDHIF